MMFRIKELSDKIEVANTPLLSSFQSGMGTEYQAKAGSTEELIFWRNFENNLGYMARRAGYNPGDVFEYSIVVKRKSPQ
ncbi:MAG: hypothetical protein Q7S06_02750 [Nanoarchaeota archaeon]|nr:hypothetical protein [Nanoarchaeota archaeon]